MIYVICKNRLFGKLTQDAGSLDIVFTYEDVINKEDYLHGLNEKVNHSDRLFPIFNNMLPEHEQKELLIAKYNISNDIDILAHLDNIHGSFEFLTQEEFEHFKPKDWIDFTYNEKAKEILNNNYKYPNILKDFNLDIAKEILQPIELANSKVMGLSGYQYKLSIDFDIESKKITKNESRSSDYFMKPYSEYRSTFVARDRDRSYIPYLLINEHIFMTLARDFGFDVPYNAIIKDGMDYHYIIKRYDRYKDSKIDHTELLTLMGKPSNEKYNVTMQDVFKEAKKHLSHSEQLKLLKFIIFSIVIAHGDLHAKNISLIDNSNAEGEKEKQMSPFYDISSTKIYKETSVNDIGLKVLNKKSKIKKNMLYAFADIINIDRNYIDKYLTEICGRFKDKFMGYIEKLPDEIKALQFHTNQYSSSSLQDVFRRYYDNRIKYIEKSLIPKSKEQEEKDEENMWG